MTALLVVVGGVLGIWGLFRFFDYSSRTSDRTSPADVRRTIEGFLTGQLGPWDWDEFLSLPIKGPRLEAISRHCGRLPDEFPPSDPSEYCGAGGIAVLQAYVEELRALEAEGSSS